MNFDKESKSFFFFFFCGGGGGGGGGGGQGIRAPSFAPIIFTILNTYVPLIFHAKIQPKISSGSGEKIDFVFFAIFSNGGHLGYST